MVVKRLVGSKALVTQARLSLSALTRANNVPQTISQPGLVIDSHTRLLIDRLRRTMR